MWEKVNLQKVIYKPISGEWGDEGDSIKIIRTTNFTNSGRLHLHEVVTRDINLEKVNKKKLVKGDTIIEKSGGSPTQPVGRVVYFNEDDLYLCNNFTSVIRPKENVNGKYLFWFLFNNHVSKRTLKYQNKTTGIINLKLENYINEIEIPLPPLPIQQKIATILDKADELRRKDKDLQAKYDELVQAIFIDMFGDPVKNEKGWDIVSFGMLIDVITDYHANGSYKILNENVKLKNTEDFALMVRTTDLENENFIKDCIYLNEVEYNFLKKTKVFGGEIIISKIGSAGKVYMMPNLNRPVTLGMNCFLIRLNSTVDKTFLYSQLKSKYGESEINKRIFGAVTKTITKDAVRNIPLLLPPLHLQQSFARKIELINQLKAQINTEKSEELFQSLLQKAFKGELFS